MDREEAWRHWHIAHYTFRTIDLEVGPFLDAEIHSNWLAKARTASLLSQQSVADRLQIRQSSYAKFEWAEDCGTISLNGLRKCAAAMDCELVYAIRPKPCRTFGRKIWQILADAVPEKESPVHYAYLARQKMYDPWFRMRQGWAQNTESEAQEVAHDLNLFRNMGVNSVGHPHNTELRPEGKRSGKSKLK